MSFRNRLTLFFIVIVIVPMIAVAGVLFQLVSDSTRGRDNARLAQAQSAAQGLFEDARSRATEAGRQIGQDAGLSTAIAARDRAGIQAGLETLARRTRAEHVRAELDGLGRFEVGRGSSVAWSTSRLVGADGAAVGRLRVSLLSAPAYIALIDLTTTLAGIVTGAGGRVLATAAPDIRNPASLPLRGSIMQGEQELLIAGFQAEGADGGSTQVRLLLGEERGDSPVNRTTAVVAGALLGFLLLAFAFALIVSRSLQAQVQRLLEAARRLGAGDFRIQVPTEGNDEFAALGSEFNSMARELEARLEELQQERARLQDAIRRVGESFAKGLDRDALLGIVVQTAVDGVGADCGRARVRLDADGAFAEVAETGDLTAHEAAIVAVEAQARRTGSSAEAAAGGARALAQPLRSSDGHRFLGLIAVARMGRPFTDPEKELFNYLANQAAVSMENVDLHETAQRQAVTDELTGLFNHRRFQEVMALEVERTRRSGSELALVMLDIDDFKQVNDTYGHITGDMVLREVGQVLRDSAREIDEPARYGGEEMAVALPETDLAGAYQFAERVRRRIEGLELTAIGTDGTLRVTASFGAAALSRNAGADKEALVAAADAALYRAKRAGKNRTVRAE